MSAGQALWQRCAAGKVTTGLASHQSAPHTVWCIHCRLNGL